MASLPLKDRPAEPAASFPMIRFPINCWLALLAICGTVMADDPALPQSVLEQPAWPLFIGPPPPEEWPAEITAGHGLPPHEVEAFPPGRLNAWHSRWSSNVISAAHRLDTFFADSRLDEESNDTRIKLSLGVYASEVDGTKMVNKANLRLRLPGTSKRLQLVFEDLVESDDPNAASDVISDISDSTPDAALRYNLRKKKNYKIDADLGVRLGGANPVFTRVRGERRFRITDDTKLRLTESVRWLSNDGWESLTQAEVDYQITWNWLFRSKSELEWPEEKRGVRPAQTFTLFQTLTRRRAIKYAIGGNWPESPGPTETRYYASVSFRRLVHSNWIYIEIEPGVEFLQEEDYDATFFGTVKFDFILGDVE